MEIIRDGVVLPLTAIDRYRGGRGNFHNYEDKTHILPDYQRKVLSPLIRMVQKTFPTVPKIIIADIAGGKGEAAAYFTSKINNSLVTTLDISQSGLKYVIGNKVRALAEELPFASNSIHMLHFKDALVHIHNKNSLMAEFSRVLVPGGIALITSQSPECDYFPILEEDKSTQQLTTKRIEFSSFTEYKYFIELAKQKKIPFGPPYFRVDPSIIKKQGLYHGLKTLDQICLRWTPPSQEEDWYDNATTRFVLSFQKPMQKRQ